MIITFQSTKGGTGKSTLSLHSAQGLANLGYKVLLVDSDPQASARDWLSARTQKPDFNFMALDTPTLHRDIPPIAQDYQFTVIDGCPRNSNLCRSAIAASDIILIPTQPSPLDIWAISETVELFKEVQMYRQQMRAAFVINLKVYKSVLAKEAQDVLAQYGLPVLRSQISRRICFPEATAVGSTVLDFQSQAYALAKQEVLSFIEEIHEEWLNQN